MDLSLERDSTAIGSLFQQIITDMKNTSPLWDDFVAKASKLHACLKAAIQAIAAYLDAFQKIADAATNSRGASKEIGTALTRVCLRHKAVETRMKTFTTAIMDCLIIPLQDKLEDWKRQVAILDKEHAKEYKRCRTELKKRSSDTLRLQKKARKGQSETIQSLVDSHMHDVTLRRAELEEVEKKSLRAAMIEERMRYCSFVNMLQPVVKEECEVMSELGHLQEAMDSIAIVTKEPNVLPQSSEELISESKYSINLYPESPGGGSGSQGCSNSLGSRKSSVCSISSMNSSGSSGSPGHHHYQRSLSQLISPTIRLKPGESSDSGFCSSPALTSQTSTNTSQTHAVSTWPPHSQDAVQTTDRPHTISSAYEKGHQRPALTVYTFQNPENFVESQKSPATMSCRPPLPVRCSSLERPLSSSGTTRNNVNLMQRQCPSPIPAHITKEISQHQPTYVNMSELASMAALKITNQQLQQQIIQQQQHQHQQQQQQIKSDSSFQNTQPLSQTSPDSSSSTVTNQRQLSLKNTIATTPISGVIPSNINTCDSLASSSSQNNSPKLINSPQPSTIGNCGGSGVGDTINNTMNINPIDTTVTFIKEPSLNGKNELKITETDNNVTTTNATTTIINNTTISSPSNNTTTTTTVNSNLNINSNLNESCSSPDKIDDTSLGSVLEKTSMFEKLEQKQLQSLSNNQALSHSSGKISHSSTSSSTLSQAESIYGSKKDDTYKITSSQNQQASTTAAITTTTSDKDTVDKVYEDSIQELNNLIGELDSFQREHELKEQSNRVDLDELNQHQQQQHQHNSNHQLSFIQNVDNNTIDSDKLSIGSLNYSTLSNQITNNLKSTSSDSEISRYDINGAGGDTNSIGFENPTFAHLNNTLNSRNSNYDDTTAINNNRSNFIIYDSNSYLITPDIDYLKQNSEIVVLRCKENSVISTGTTATDNNEDAKQRLSSFRCDQLLQLQQLQQTQQQEQQLQQQQQLQKEQNENEHQHQLLSPKLTQGMIKTNDNYKKHKYSLKQNDENSYSVNNTSANKVIVTNLSSSSMKEFKANLDERLRSKPTISPRPASLSGCVTRIARRSSVNSTKPPPPVRRSSSVTPSHNLTMPNSTNLIQQSVMNSSTESLPPPPAYLLDSSRTNNISPSINVAETVKALTVIRHTPASPGAVRKAQNQINQSSIQSPRTQNSSSSSSSSGIYAQPKQITKMSSFRTPSPGPQKSSTSLLAQLNARLTPNKHTQQPTSQSTEYSNSSGNSSYNQNAVYQDNRNQSQLAYGSGPNSPHHHQQQQQHQNYVQSDQIYAKTSDTYYGDQQSNYDDYSPVSSEKSGSIKNKTKAEFLESLNAKLAKQGLSGKAFAVRNFINSRALGYENLSRQQNQYRKKIEPDPRLCHESLMDQIKRGAPLKRNRTINDRSAPKIH